MNTTENFSSADQPAQPANTIVKPIRPTSRIPSDSPRSRSATRSSAALPHATARIRYDGLTLRSGPEPQPFSNDLTLAEGCGDKMARSSPRRRVKFPAQPQEWKIVSLRECPTPDIMQQCETPDQAAAYWKAHIPDHPYFNPECECLVVLILNTRRRVRGHYLVSIGTMDTILCHPREVFRLAIMAGAAAIIPCHNHPSGDATPSEADVKITRDLIRAGQLLKIEVLDHIIVGNPNYSSLRTLGYFAW